MIKLILFICFTLQISSILTGQEYNEIKYPHRLIDIECNIRSIGTFIIYDYKEFKNLCSVYLTSKIDFENEILIGVIQTTGGCQEPITSIDIIKNTELKTLECLVSIESIGICRKLFPVIKWFIFQKPPEGYDIEVRIKKFNNTK
jgi:hypothetical protein